MDGLGIRDPQAYFLYDNISTRSQLRPTPRKEAYPKRPVPASYVSILLQNVLLKNTHPFALPVPLMSCPRIGEIVLRVRKIQIYRVSKTGSSVPGRPRL